MGITEKNKFTANLSGEEETFFSHIYDLSQRAFLKDCAFYGDFLSEGQQSELLKRERMLPLKPVLFGGYEDAERKMAGFIPEGYEGFFPIAAVRFTGRNISKLTHRDFLGSIMGLGIKREKCGDIIINKDECFAIMQRDIANFTANSIIKIGREGVNAEFSELDCLNIPERQFKSIKGTVASLRLDAVLALLISSGRNSAMEMIKSGKVFISGICVMKPDFHLNDGDVISVRGTGKAILKIGGTSRKDRIFITLDKYI